MLNEPIPLAIRADVSCPFCAGHAELHKQLRGGHVPHEHEAYAYFYICDSCAACGGWGKSEGSALRMWNMRSTGKYCRGEGCPRADLCRRHMDAVAVENPIYFEKSPMLADGQCGEFASNGWLRTHPTHCGGAHPPPQCAWQCKIELHRWEKRGDEWIWTGGVEHQVKYRLESNAFGRWIIVHPEHAYLAWSGSRWVPHYKGLGKIAQVSNFDTQEAADETARQQIA